LILAKTTDRDISNIRAMARRMKIKNPKLDVIFVDYLQKISMKGQNNKAIEVTEISQILTDMSDDLDVCVVALAQLNRESDAAIRPSMKHLKDSSGIEENAHLITFVHRNITETFENQQCQLVVDKNRDGETGLVDVAFTRKTTKFSGVTFGDNYNERGM